MAHPHPADPCPGTAPLPRHRGTRGGRGRPPGLGGRSRRIPTIHSPTTFREPLRYRSGLRVPPENLQHTSRSTPTKRRRRRRHRAGDSRRAILELVIELKDHGTTVSIWTASPPLPSELDDASLPEGRDGDPHREDHAWTRWTYEPGPAEPVAPVEATEYPGAASALGGAECRIRLKLYAAITRSSFTVRGVAGYQHRQRTLAEGDSTRSSATKDEERSSSICPQLDLIDRQLPEVAALVKLYKGRAQRRWWRHDDGRAPRHSATSTDLQALCAWTRSSTL